MKIKLDARRVVSRLAQLPRRNRITLRRILNRQRTQGRTLITRWLSRRLKVSPQKRIRRRIWLPVTGQATIRNLTTTNLQLVELLPVRWFRKRERGRYGKTVLNVPAGATLVRKKGSPPYVDASRVGYRVRDTALRWLARRFPREYRRLWKVQLRRVGFG